VWQVEALPVFGGKEGMESVPKTERKTEPDFVNL
jgi:hypothetical protein